MESCSCELGLEDATLGDVAHVPHQTADLEDVAEVDDGVRAHARLTEHLAEVKKSRALAEQRVASARAASEAVTALAAQVKRARADGQVTLDGAGRARSAHRSGDR